MHGRLGGGAAPHSRSDACYPGLDTLTDGLLAFWPLSRELPRPGSGHPAAARTPTVLELTDDIFIDAGVLEACRRLHDLAYRLVTYISALARCRAGGCRYFLGEARRVHFAADAANQALSDSALLSVTYADALARRANCRAPRQAEPTD